MRIAAPLTVALVLLAGCADDDSQLRTSLPRAQSPSAAPSDSAPTAAASSPAAAPSPSATATASRAVYWLGAAKDRRGPRLYREFVRRPDTGRPIRDALEAMLALEPTDRDYTSLWADGTRVLEVRKEGTTAVVDLSSQATRNGGGSAAEAASLQQLVHTATAADPSVKAVRLLVEGRQVETLWGSTDTTRPLTRAPASEVLGPVWIDVAEGGTVRGSFGGTASVFEATVSWEVRRGDRVVQDGFSTASIGAPGRGDWTAEVDVPPGDYVLWAYESSAEDGSVTWLDTKAVTVTG